MLVFVNELCLGAFRGGPVYFAYLRSPRPLSISAPHPTPCTSIHFRGAAGLACRPPATAVSTRATSQSHCLNVPCRVQSAMHSAELRRMRFDLISLGRCCVVAEGAKLRPAAAEERQRTRAPHKRAGR